ncbi:hypothetical protein TNCV_3023221 [Trichonephila clavipes]|uniref:Uncharacterized protein n=1 Tax=Trichonephila clavipes TaxID=2585209 RepID=A0A8X6V019_TRICX|nr:hypothetical protein TNCV_3023221 [Trichonephila clavipes]
MTSCRQIFMQYGHTMVVRTSIFIRVEDSTKDPRFRGDSSEVQIHTFSDASQKAYGAAAFLRESSTRTESALIL